MRLLRTLSQALQSLAGVSDRSAAPGAERRARVVATPGLDRFRDGFEHAPGERLRPVTLAVRARASGGTALLQALTADGFERPRRAPVDLEGGRRREVSWARPAAAFEPSLDDLGSLLERP